LEGDAKLQQHIFTKALYQPLNTTTQPIKIKLIPYYAWANRGQTDMTVWLPLIRN
jgi:DUF1680 family protein